ncbi:probable glycosyltransferase At5g03795 [Cucurbita pepo subsp. pepo]|uniref:probable glycosyltransferase At5g03795 n=1 Tax=Cucurbita pepo subsp. pepo TaxID=3664 RepID=UPI000C9D569A|nr:probable glycosyltransferase At5g03795 [Cucurbita pepo subsp. pepo]
MGQELCSISQIGSRRVIWLMGVMFAMILAFQCFELSFGYSLFSLFSVGKVIVNEEGSSSSSPVDDPISKTGLVAESPLADGINSTASNHSYDRANQPSSSGDLIEPVGNSTINMQGNNRSFDGKDDSLRNDSIGYNNHSSNNFAAPPAVPPTSSSLMIVGNTSSVATNASSPNSSLGSNAPDTSDKLKTSVEEKDEKNTSDKNEKTEPLHGDHGIGKNKTVSEKKQVPKDPSSGIYTISDMDSLLFETRSSNRPIVPRWPSATDQEVLQAKLLIENAPGIDNDPILYSPLFRNVSVFKRSYELMEKTLKVYIYAEGERPIFHQGPLQGIYASEGWFMKILESNKRFVTKDPKKAHLFYLPFSSRQLEDTLYVRDSHSFTNLIQHLKNYLDLIAAKYPSWNRTEGADHFIAACHDWAPAETRKYMAKCIRALCNSDVKEGFVFGKDVSLPETSVRVARNPLKDVGGNPASKRPILAFFAGRMHGNLRSILVKYWEGKDPDMKISGPMPKVKGKGKKGGGKNYLWHMKNSKYCICAKGYEVNSPRVVESIMYECVPVIISDNFVPPLFGVLNWESFAVFVAEKEIPNLKKILTSIPEKRYREMQMRVKKVQPHFLWHSKPQKYDLFHMILHSIWYNRLYQITPNL